MKKILGLCLAGALFFSCSHGDDDDDNGPYTIQLTSEIQIESRASLQTDQIEDGQVLSFFATKYDTPSVIRLDNLPLDATGGGNLAFRTPIYYPTQDETWDFIAVNPYTSTADLSELLEFEVLGEQNIRTNYLNSDLLYGMASNVSPTGDAIRMTFKHKLSKISFIVKQGTGSNLAGLTQIQVQNIYKQANLNLRNGNVTSVPSNPGIVNAYGVKGTSEAVASEMNVIVPPQVFVADHSNKKALFRIFIGTEEFYYYPTDDITFEEGKNHNYIITVMGDGIRVTSSVIDWNEEGDTSL